MNFDWISFESKEEEALYGHSGLIVEYVFDRVREENGSKCNS